MDNWYQWQSYVNDKIDEFQAWKEKREQDLTMQNLRMQRLLDAALQRIGEVEEQRIKVEETNAYLERQLAG